jgi:hypothetical protein
MPPPYPRAIRNPVQARHIAVNEREQLEARYVPQGRKMAQFDGKATSDYGQPYRRLRGFHVDALLLASLDWGLPSIPLAFK